VVCTSSALHFSAAWLQWRIGGPDCLSASEFPGRPELQLSGTWMRLREVQTTYWTGRILNAES